MLTRLTAAALVAAAFLAGIAHAGGLVVLSNWKACAIGPLSDSGDVEADWASVPAWTKSLARYFYDEPRLLANHGLCNEKFHRVVLCLPAWEYSEDKTANWFRICDGVTKRNIAKGR
jgi:hypothetical protein